MTDYSIEEEQQSAILNCNHNFYSDIPQDKDKNGVADNKEFCDKCGLHYIMIVNGLQKEINKKTDKGYLSPKCQVCGFQITDDKFVSECWLQIPYSTDGGEHGVVIWVCPDCIAKKSNAS